MSEQDKRERAGEWAKGDAEATRFISLDDAAEPSGDTPAPTAAAPKRRLALLAAAAACCVVVLVASLGFVYPAEDGSWSLSWLFATTQEVQDSDSTAASDGAHASDEGAEGASSATDANADGDAADLSADAEGTDNNGQAQSGTATDGSAGAGLGASSPSGADSAGSSATTGGQNPGASSGNTSNSGTSSAPADPQTITISVSVSSSAVGGSVASSGTFTFAEGATAYDALCALGLSVNAQNSAYGVYVSAIGGLAQFDHGSNSGWMFSVNGTSPNKSASAYVLSDGDVVSWYYVV